MEYTFFSPEEFQYSMYEKIAKELERFPKNEEERAIMDGILFQGGYQEYSVNSFGEAMNRWNSSIEARRRISMAYLISQYPETFDYLRKNNVGLFHGTDSMALPGIINGGLKSFEKIKKDGEEIVSGEKWTMDYRSRNNSGNFISMSDDLETIFDYSMCNGSKNDGKFGVVIGINQDAFKQLRTCTVHSDTTEVGIREHIPSELINFIGVPEDKVELVRKMVGDKKMVVMPMPLDHRDKFYYIDDMGMGDIKPEISNRLLEKGSSKNRVFGNKTFNKLASMINPNNLVESLKKLKDMISPKEHKDEKGGNENEK